MKNFTRLAFEVIFFERGLLSDRFQDSTVRDLLEPYDFSGCAALLPPVILPLGFLEFPTDDFLMIRVSIPSLPSCSGMC